MTTAAITTGTRPLESIDRLNRAVAIVHYLQEPFCSGDHIELDNMSAYGFSEILRHIEEEIKETASRL